jgi:hypothetical protein
LPLANAQRIFLHQFLCDHGPQVLAARVARVVTDQGKHSPEASILVGFDFQLIPQLRYDFSGVVMQSVADQRVVIGVVGLKHPLVQVDLLSFGGHGKES